MALNGIDTTILGIVGDERGTKLFPVSIRIALTKDFRRHYGISLADVDVEKALNWLVKHEYLTCEDRNRSHTRELIYAFAPKGKSAYDEILETRVCLESRAGIR